MTVGRGGGELRSGLDDGALSPHARINRESWNEVSLTYQLDHGPQLAESGGLGWGGLADSRSGTPGAGRG